MGVHEVKRGEHLASIAERYGFSRHEPIAEHPDNAELFARRKPEILLAGDVVAIPEREIKSIEAPSGRAHRFTIKQDRLELRLRLRGLDGAPRGDVPCTIGVEGKDQEVSTDAEGTVVTSIAASVQRVTVSFDGESYEVEVGALDPLDEDTGWQARLVNLGYLEEIIPRPAPGEEADADDAREIGAAIEEFQCDHGLKQTGTLDGPTKARLLEEHGC